jgi:hypothetical protein
MFRCATTFMKSPWIRILPLAREFPLSACLVSSKSKSLVRHDFFRNLSFSPDTFVGERLTIQVGVAYFSLVTPNFSWLLLLASALLTLFSKTV